MKHETYTMNNGEEIIIPIPTCYKDAVRLLQSDNYRYTGKIDNLLKIWLYSFFERSIKYLFWFRLASYKGLFYPVCKYRQIHYREKFGCMVHPGTRIGYGLYLGHAISMCVNINAIIGNNVNLSQMTNIGSNESKGAIIGNNVYIGPMTCLVEDVQIGSNCSIGAGAVVTKDIPSNSTAVGVPAKVIGLNRHPEYVPRRWKNE